MPHKNLATLFQNRTYLNAARAGIKYTVDGREASLSWQQVGTEVRNIGRALLARGLKPGDRVGIWSRLQPEAILAELATISLGGVSIAIDPEIPFETGFQQLQRSGAPYLFLEGKESIEQTMKRTSDLQSMKVFVALGQKDAPHISGIPSLSTFKSDGRAVPAVQFYDRLEQVGSDNEACWIFGNGGRENSSEFRLTHAQILANSLSLSESLALTSADTCLSLLPLSHATERTFGLYAMICSGAAIAFSERPEDIVPDLSLFRPNLLLCRNRTLSQIHHHFQEHFRSALPPMRYLFQSAVADASTPTLAGRFVFPRIRKMMGGEIRTVAYPQEDVDPNVAAFFRAMEIDLLPFETAPDLPNVIGLKVRPFKGKERATSTARIG
ncbi:MAG TPA: AMP-binding protein [Bdellovibrionota bacterium]|nr:AMP-binding protein [Bdellovibrionota bacterium]